MKIIKLITLLLLVLSTTSCYNYLEVNEIAIVEGISIEYIDNKYNIIVEVIDFKTDNENSYLLEGTSGNIKDAFNNIKELSSKELSMSHLETLIVSKNILLNNIDNISTYFINEKDITTNFYLVYSNNPSDIMHNKNNNYPINTKTITDLLDKNKNKKYQFDYIFTSIKNNKAFEVPVVSLNNNNIKIDKEYLLYEKWYCY